MAQQDRPDGPLVAAAPSRRHMVALAAQAGAQGPGTGNAPTR